MKKILLLVSCLLMVASGSAFAQSKFSPYVDKEGNITRPTDFKTNPDWVHLGSWAVVNENGEGNGLHNVYTTRVAAEYFRENGGFPDGAPLVKEVRGAAAATLTTGRAHWATDPVVWFVSIKDQQGRFKENPLWGDGWGWALFNAAEPAKQVATDYKKDCIDCHVPVKDSDWTYIYAYAPVLGPQVTAFAPKQEEVSAGEEASNTDATVDLAAAKKRFRSNCAACHSDRPGVNGIGPSLAGVIGRKAGSVSGFNYSPAMKSSDVVWSAETLDQHLSDVKTFIPGSRMAILFPNGVKDANQRAEIIAYLESISK